MNDFPDESQRPPPRRVESPGIRRGKKPCPPFCWLEKISLEAIRTRCEDPRSTLGVYLALCEIASDEHSDSFPISASKIAAKACLSQRTVFDRIKDLERIGLIEIKHEGHASATSRIPNTYTLLKCETH